MDNLASFFRKEQEFYLDSVYYTRIQKSINESEVQMLCTDTVQAKETDDNRVIVTVTREVKFEPELLFKLSVSYGVVLQFNENKSKADWSNIDLSREFKENGGFATTNLFNRISLLIGEITSSFGQSPMIIPPQFLMTE